MNSSEILAKLRSLENPDNRAGMARYGLNPEKAYGVPMPVLRKLAREIGRNHTLAAELWKSDVYEARMLASFIDYPGKVTEKQMEEWVKDFDSWGICDTVCSNLFDRTRLAPQKAVEWSLRKEEFVKRAGFVLMATLAVHDKKACDEPFRKFLEIIRRESGDQRNFVRKAVNWALRQIGKRSLYLNRHAIKTAHEISRMESKSARWIASDALRELQSDAVQKRLRLKKSSTGS